MLLIGKLAFSKTSKLEEQKLALINIFIFGILYLLDTECLQPQFIKRSPINFSRIRKELKNRVIIFVKVLKTICYNYMDDQISF
jgi:hypothetical protein